ncbi:MULTISPECIES: hypothetical protein [Elizabethkingia]|uniref:NERD domain-containing protein n=1 Tax=Elizabethkingia ursingii TaxID=1756150 RepID=A0AAJ3NCM4_9FLAO|nr:MULTISPECIES: hypothetical protein [Elizabethkingia]AQW92881.1 hypothetical protein BBD30_01040 [Elizabethkingia anophelis]AQX09829.1 hypothetical protein BBD34_14830 [Elizabethkingia ursingii]OPB65704.1 hypothetical protein BAS07_15070 [Elizabethkingia anophelis]OPB75972.1 hypothetical protein BAY32_04200 [Elizabethkingia ursingii]OPB84639.1 hypothetical protein BB021_14880 [Elizabethkingia ursingii]
MDLENRIDALQKLVSKYDVESFAGFFAFFIKRHPDPALQIDLNKFESKLKDFLYLISLNAFSSHKGNKKFEIPYEDLGTMADRLNEIKNLNNPDKINEYTRESAIHEMAVRNHFDNGVLSYVEQDLDKIRRIFTPFEAKIVQDFGFDINFLIEISKMFEAISIIRFRQQTSFMDSSEFSDFYERINSKEMSFSKAFELLPLDSQEAFLSFSEKNYAHLIFTAEDLYLAFDKEKVDKFLALFSREPLPDITVRYYTAESPFELTPFLRFNNGNYLSLYGKQLPTSIYKVLYTHLLKEKNFNSKLRKHREKNLEYKVRDIFMDFFPKKETFFYENYVVDGNCEQDLLIIFKGNVLIVEVKAAKLREPFRDVNKAITRLKEDFKNSIQYGFDQCERVEDYFYDDELFDIKDEKGRVLYTVNPKKINAVYSIIVTLERFGPLQSDLSLMLQKDVDIDYPWAVYIDDLEIFLLAVKETVSGPVSQFFNFLTYRRELHGRMYAGDELDVCATYLQNPFKFKQYSENKELFLTFSPYEQGDFDKLYWAGKINFKEKSLPDGFHL